MNLRYKSTKFWLKASQAETNLSNQQANFYSTLTQDYNTQFANQSAILGSLTKEFEPILAAGPSQTGFSPGELQALQTGASDQIGTAYKNSQQQLQNSLAAEGGGNTFLPSGAADQLKEEVGTAAAAQNATAQNQIQLENYQQGNANFNQAVSALGGVAAQTNPLGYAGANTGAGEAAFGSANTVANQNNWLGAVGGILGGAASAALGNPALMGGL